ncbi:MAG: hypothetical protein M3Y52_10745 [Actinomycetota bacterium]|nr:hypothetical protein [Actinomycetota bacterium]
MSSDRDRAVVEDPHAPPEALFEIAGRRWDLHPAIDAHPRVYPALRQWIAEVNPVAEPNAPAAQPSPNPQPAPTAQPAMSPPQYHPVPPGQPVPPPRRTGSAWWLAGCGCLTVVGIILIVALLVGALGAGTSPDSSAPVQPSDTTEVDEYLAAFRTEVETIRTLSAAFDGNPVAPLILDQLRLAELEAKASASDITVWEAKSIEQNARWMRESLEPLIAAAEQRRVNVSGKLSEAMVDEAANGYIDIVWDAAEHCGPSSGEEYTVTGCAAGGSSPVIHLLPDSTFSSEWALRMTVIHELAHIYQSADAARFADRVSDAHRLVEQGMFAGSRESMADCFALTYYGEWVLADGLTEVGYGYICNEAERQAIRDWAASLKVPMPG